MANEFIIKNGFQSKGTSNVTGSLIITGSSTFIGNQVVTGSNKGNITALSIASSTASLDLTLGNFYTLQLVSGSNTYINISNIQAGQTSIINISTTGSGTVSFPSSVKQPSGSSYVPTTTTSTDILTLVSTNSSTVHIVSAKNLV
jgi:hypothetical protein